MPRKNKTLNTEECVALLNVDLVKGDAIASVRAKKSKSTPKKVKKRSRSRGGSYGFVSLEDSTDSDSDCLSEENWGASVAYDSAPAESDSVELNAARVKKLKVMSFLFCFCFLFLFFLLFIFVG